ncbi:unnamed protein product [Coregonus sp. 'balchen']|nr:unnamed protein product [Coregonus sp. 'balchen']
MRFSGFLLPDKKVKVPEKKVNDLIEESYLAHGCGDLQVRQREDEEGFSEAHLCLLGIDEEDKYIPPNDDTHANLVIEAIKNDKFHQMERERKALAEKLIMTSAKLISPTIAAGFDWCVDMVKSSQYIELANDLEITKAITYLR